MREIYLDTENIDRSKLKELQQEDGTKAEGTEIVKKMLNHEIYAQMYGEKDDGFSPESYQVQSKGILKKLGKWNSRKCALALYTVNQDVILEELQDRFEL
jgi:hypothetical protein